MPYGDPLRDASHASTVGALRALATGAANPLEETRRRLRESQALLRRLDRTVAAAKWLMGGDPPGPA
jgi:hypothetical protein